MEGIETLEMTKMTSKVKDNGQILMMIQKEGIIKVKNKTLGPVIMIVMETLLEKERVIIISQAVKIIKMIQNQNNKTKEKIHLTLFLVMIISNKQKNNKRIIKNQHQLEKTHLMMIHSMTLKNKINKLREKTRLMMIHSMTLENKINKPREKTRLATTRLTETEKTL